MKNFMPFFRRLSLIFLPYGWLILFFFIPVLIILKISFADFVIGLPPYGPLVKWASDKVLQINLNFSSYGIIFSDDLYGAAYLSSLWIAALSTFICLIMGYPMAYAIARSSPRLRTLLLMLVILPFWTSFLIRVYAWINLLNPQGIINSILQNLGFGPFNLLDNTFAVVVGIVYSYLPFMILPLYSSLEKIDPSIHEAASDLGCRPLRAFFTITLPLSLSGAVAGSILVFIPAVGEFVIPELLGGSDTLMIGRILWNEFFVNRDWPVASALAIVMLVVLVLPIVMFQRIQEREDNS